MEDEDGDIGEREYRVGTLEEALDLALELKAKGTYDLFRDRAVIGLLKPRYIG